MTNKVELISDGEAVVVVGEKSAVAKFLNDSSLAAQAKNFDLRRLNNFVRHGARVAAVTSNAIEKSAMYLKLTPESAEQLRAAGGLMKTKEEGISYAMLGETGKTSLKWLRVENGSKALISNPAILSGMSGLMAQFTERAEAQEIKALLVRIDGKLDDVRRSQRDAVLAKMHSAAAQIAEAKKILDFDGDSQTMWDKVSGVSESITDVQHNTLLALGALADKVEDKRKAGALKKAMSEVEREASVHLAVLGRCFELQNHFREIELRHVLVTAPERFDRHRRALTVSRNERRDAVLEQTSRLMDRMRGAHGVAEDNVLLHARAARSVTGSLNSTAEAVDEFHMPLGITAVSDVVKLTPWRIALRDPEKRKVAAIEAGQKGLTVAGAVATAGAALIVKSNSGSKSS